MKKELKRREEKIQSEVHRLEIDIENLNQELAEAKAEIKAGIVREKKHQAELESTKVMWCYATTVISCCFRWILIKLKKSLKEQTTR